MASKMVPDPPCPKKLQISAQDDLLQIHYKARALLNTLLMQVNLSECAAQDLYEYLRVVSDLSDQAISILQQMIRRSYEMKEKDIY
jgi:hypothetical protein